MDVTESKGFYRFNGSSEKNLDMFPPPPQTYVPSSPTFDTLYGKPVQNIKSVPSAHFSWQGRNWRSDDETWHAPKQAVLPPIGVFWDIENCQIPHGKSALVVAQAIRAKFFEGYREAEFLVVCDVKKESNQVIQELNDAQVNLMHVCSKSKNAADEKLRQALRRFAEIHSFPSAIILISSDIDFATDLSDLRHRKKIHIILLHANSCSESLIMCANEHYNFGELVNPLPSRGSFQDTDQTTELVVWYPYNCDTKKVKMRLKYLSQNCGGKISFVSEFYAIISFPTMDSAIRAHKRMKGETLFGSEITITTPHLFLSKKNNGSYPTFTSFDGLEQKSRKRSLPLWYTPDERHFNGECKSFNEIGTYNTPQELLNNYVYMGFNVTNELFVSPWNRPHIITQNEQIINPSGAGNLSIEEISEQSSAFERFKNNHSGFSCNETANSELKISVLSNFHPVNNGIDNVTHQCDPLINSTKDRQTAFEVLLSIDESSMQSSVSETSTVQTDNEIASSLKPPVERLSSLLYNNSKEKLAVAKDSIPDDSISTRQNKHKIMGHCLKHTKKECVEECNDMTVSPLSKIVICLKTFSKNVRTLLHSHDNILPLQSFFYCYTTEFGELTISDEGVPLEHLVTCIDNVELSVSNGIKYLQPSITKMNEEFVDTGNLLPFRSETLTNALTIFCCEVIDLIKTQPYCQIPFDKFIKCYNHYYGRQCHLADYGFAHLKSLFEAVADVIQVMGESNSKIITLTHKTQMRRFSLDFVRILRLQTDQKILLSELPSIFENILLHPFNPVDYGVCKVEDLISCISSSLLTSPADNDIIIYLKTKQSKDKTCKLNKSQCLKKGKNKKESQSLTEKSDSVVTKLSNLSIAPSDVHQPSSCSPNSSLQDKPTTSKSKRSQWETLLDSPPCDNTASSSTSDLPPSTTSHTKKNGQLIISPDPSILPHPNIHLKSKPWIRHVEHQT